MSVTVGEAGSWRFSNQIFEKKKTVCKRNNCVSACTPTVVLYAALRPLK